ncbi:MAG: hypothetical protein WKG06_07170 [Segetibacter sp.]
MMSADVLQEQLSFTNTINQNHFLNAATIGAGLDKHLLFTNETGWTNNKETFSVLFDASKSFTSNDNDYYLGAKGERVLRENKALFSFVYVS